jgi:creatinine amidohydrolase/Fe(II)-dependent formamide hydrolase-like protein
MWIVPDEFEIFEFEVVDVFDGRIQFQSRQWTKFAGELFTRLIEMVLVKMKIAESVNEIARRKIDDLSDHHGEECVARDVERNTEEKIATALVKLAT